MQMTLQMEQIKSLEAERDNIHIGRHKDSNQVNEASFGHISTVRYSNGSTPPSRRLGGKA